MDRSSPKTRAFKDVCLVYAYNPFISFFSRFKGHSGDTFYFHFTVAFRIVGFLAVFALSSASFAEINSSGKLPDHHKIESVSGNIGAERALVPKRFVKLGGTQICKKTQCGAYTEESLFRTAVAGKVIPLRTADRAQQDAVACKTALYGFLGKRISCCVNSRAADKIRRKIKFMFEFFSGFF